ncbi:MAG: hypothetical protein MRK02_05815 [Candidatus Scalindua sp.]|nr:hypothetical protein [Candidatus Scalindua sp.]
MYLFKTGDKFASRTIELNPGLILPDTKTPLTRVLHSLLKEDLRPKYHLPYNLYSSHNGFLTYLCVRDAHRQVKSEIKLSGESPRRFLSVETFTHILFPARPACQPFASPRPYQHGLAILILAGTGKTENQIGFSIYTPESL